MSPGGEQSFFSGFHWKVRDRPTALEAKSASPFPGRVLPCCYLQSWTNILKKGLQGWCLAFVCMMSMGVSSAGSVKLVCILVSLHECQIRLSRQKAGSLCKGACCLNGIIPEPPWARGGLVAAHNHRAQASLWPRLPNLCSEPCCLHSVKAHHGFFFFPSSLSKETFSLWTTSCWMVWMPIKQTRAQYSTWLHPSVCCIRIWRIKLYPLQSRWAYCQGL